MADAPKPDTSLENAYDPIAGVLRLAITPNAKPGEGQGLSEAQKVLQDTAKQPLVPTDTEASSRVAGHARRPLAVMPIEPEASAPELELPQSLRDEYAKAHAESDTTGPQDFAERYAGALGRSDPDADTLGLTRLAKSVSAALPSTENAIDAGITVTVAAGEPLSPSTVTQTKDNLLRLWAASGEPFPAVAQYAAGDPLLRDALTTPNSVTTPAHADEGWSDEEIKAPAQGWLDPFKELLHSQLETMFGKLPGPEEMATAEAQLKKEGVDYGPADIQKRAAELLAKKLGPETKYERADRLAHLIVGGMAGPVPAGSLGAGPSMLGASKALAEATAEIKPLMGRMEHDLHLIQAANEADKAEVLKQLPPKLDPAWLKKGFQENVAKEVEQRLVDGRAPRSEEVKDFLRAATPLSDEEFRLAKEINTKLSKPVEGLRTVDQGYMHRVAVGKEFPGSFNDALVERGDVVKAGLGKQRSLSQFASGLQKRAEFYALQHGDVRTWGTRPLDQLGLEMGGTWRDPATGLDWKVKPATMEEIEANTDIRYHKNYLVNLLDNVLRLRRINRNIDFLQKWKSELYDRDLFLAEHTQHEIPEGWKRIDLPQMAGWAQPRIANVLNDFFNRSGGDLDDFLTRANNLIAHTMFVTPIPHGANVMTHWGVGRGWEWVRPQGYYSLAADGLKAAHEVWTLGPVYLDYLRSGAGLLSASVETENFYRVLMSKLFNEQVADPKAWGGLAKALGLENVRQLVAAEYKWSRQTLWRLNDVFMLQRIMELERKGLARADAIREAAKDIPDYRVPTEVLGSHAVHEALTNGKFLIFGRYKYGLINALGNMVKDMIGPNATMQQRVDAVGKLVVLGALALTLPSWWRPSGPLAPVESGKKVVTQGPDAWSSFVSSLLTLSPVIDISMEVLRNITWSGAQVVRSGGTIAGNLAHTVEQVVGHIYPGQLVMNVVKHGVSGVLKDIGQLLNLKLGPQYQPSAAAKRLERNKARGAESHDPILNWLQGKKPRSRGHRIQ